MLSGPLVHAFLYPKLVLPQPPVWFGFILAYAVCLPWVFLIVFYGVFIPNTWRRCTVVVGVMAVTPLVVSAANGLAAAATAGLVHRDIKPGNVIVATLGGQHDVAKLLDFGLVQDLTTADTRLTGAGVVLGTPAYMCPEQAGGEASVDARGDVYSLGALAFFALTGRPPFEAETLGQFLAAHLTRTPPRVDAVRSDVPADLADVVARCLAKHPAGRFQSVTELERELAACGCAADWSAERASKWWAVNPDGTTHGTADPTRSLQAEDRLT